MANTADPERVGELVSAQTTIVAALCVALDHAGHLSLAQSEAVLGAVAETMPSEPVYQAVAAVTGMIGTMSRGRVGQAIRDALDQIQ